MWFKNLQVFRLETPWEMTPEALEDQLSARSFQACGAMDMETWGWLPPFGKDGLVRVQGGQWLLCLGHEQKLLPASVVNQVTQDRAAEIEEKEGYRPGRKQMREIKERVTDELLPRAFSRRRSTFVWIDSANGWLVVDAANAAKADAALEQLRKCVTDLPARLVKTKLSAAGAMRQWLELDESPAGFSVDRDCELRSDMEEKSTVRYARHALDTDEVKKHIKEGKSPTRLAMTWGDRLSFVLTERMEIKRLDFLDVVKEQAMSAESAEEQFDSDFTLMALELSRFLPDLVEALGGEEATV